VGRVPQELSTTTPHWQISVTDDSPSVRGQVRVFITDGTASLQSYGPDFRVDDGAWHHVVVSFDRDVGITTTIDGTNTHVQAGAVPGTIDNLRVPGRVHVAAHDRRRRRPAHVGGRGD
jgi:hypothetical protein